MAAKDHKEHKRRRVLCDLCLPRSDPDHAAAGGCRDLSSDFWGLPTCAAAIILLKKHHAAGEYT